MDNGKGQQYVKIIFLAIIAILIMLMAYMAHAAGHTLPDPKLTPGANDPSVVMNVSIKKLCDPGGYVKKNGIRNVPESVKHAVYKSYGLSGNHTGYCDSKEGCELDHSCSLELGCNNSPKNLWPQKYDGPLNAHDKDKLENKLHKMVCAGQISLHDAQIEISTDWVKAYNKYVK